MSSSGPSSLLTRVTLNDGVTMPVFGLGSGGMMGPDGKIVTSVSKETITHALNVGYRLIDTAENYNGAEEIVGETIKNIGSLNRDDIFIVDKVWKHGRQETLDACHSSLQKLGVTNIDLYLIHIPHGGKILETYDTMLELKDQGLVKSVGVANFGVHHIEALLSQGRPLPSVNQLELHPWQQKNDLVKYCKKNNISVMASSPLTKGQNLGKPELAAVGKRCGMTPAQVLLRWNIQKGYIPIVKSSSVAHISDNAHIFDFSLSDEDMTKLDSFDQVQLKRPYDWNPTELPWES